MMGLAPVVSPVAVVANEPDTLVRFFGGSHQLAGAALPLFELSAPIAIRVRSIYGAADKHGLGWGISGLDLITAAAAVVPSSSTTGVAPQAIVRRGTGTAPPGAYAYHNSSYNLPSSFAYNDPFILPPDRLLYIFGISAEPAAGGFAWEELGD